MENLEIPNDLHGLRFDLALSRLYPQYSRSQLTSWIKQGYVTVNDKKIQSRDKIFFKDQVKWLKNPENLETSVNSPLAEAIPLQIIYEDETILVINKPANLVVHPGAGIKGGTLLNALLYHDESLAALPRAGIVHRLDKDTTGLLVIAKTLQAHTFLIREMQERKINREYLCLVCGQVKISGEINTYYGRHAVNRLKMAVTKTGKQAITFYSPREFYPNFTLLTVKLQTGRTHQIRVHMAHINHPVVGDPLYGKKLVLPATAEPGLFETVSQFKRQALHAAFLSFLHPLTKEPLTFHADIPQDFESLLSVLQTTG